MVEIVIGSGPAGVSVATALLAKGRKVMLLDGGKVLEKPNQVLRDRMAAKPPNDWSDPQRRAYQDPQFHAADGQARRFGSDFAMETARATQDPINDDFALRSSRAVGGLSNLWGAAVLPYRAQDMRHWPISVDDLAPHYKAVANLMPIAGQDDDLSSLFPQMSMANARQIAPGPQASRLLKRLSQEKAANANDGVTTGAARQAVNQGCTGCGMCLHGCPWGYIYSANQTLADLKTHPNFEHRPNAAIAAFSENADHAWVDLENGETLTGARVFVASGVLETARILLASGSERGRKLTMLDSQQAFLPMLHRWRTERRADALPYTTLPQIFAEIDAPHVSPNLVHSQLYTWNEYFARDLIANYGRGIGLADPVLRGIANRLIVAQMFLHSDHSSTVDLRLSPNQRLVATPHSNPETELVMKRARKTLDRVMARAGMLSLGFATRLGPIGSSFHAGGTVAMSAAPSAAQSDLLGRPLGLSRVHLVDASVFSSIPATTITYSVMANAHRIGTLAP